MFNLFDLFQHTVLLTRAGSRAYGMHTPTSDIDIKGVCIPPRNFVLGLDVFNQADKASHFEDQRIRGLLSAEEQEIAKTTKVEGTIYSCRKFCALAAQANPNILDALYTREEDVLHATGPGLMLRAHRGLFLTGKAYWTFSRYAGSQMQRILTHRRWLFKPPEKAPERADFDLPYAFPSKQVEVAEALVAKKLNGWEPDLSSVDGDAERVELMDQIRNTLTDIITGIAADQDPEFLKWRSAVRGIGVDENLMLVLEKERKFKTAQEDWRKYVKWKRDRNEERAALEAKFGYDTKHGAHLVRLMRMCGEILDTGKVNVWRGGIDADELLTIRRGAWTFDKLSEFLVENDKALKAKYDAGTYSIPHHPDPNAVSALCVRLHDEVYEETDRQRSVASGGRGLAF